MEVPEVAAVLHPGVKNGFKTDRLPGDQFTTRTLTSVVRREVLASLCREWHLFAFSLCWWTTVPTIVRW